MRFISEVAAGVEATMFESDFDKENNFVVSKNCYDLVKAAQNRDEKHLRMEGHQRICDGQLAADLVANLDDRFSPGKEH